MLGLPLAAARIALMEFWILHVPKQVRSFFVSDDDDPKINYIFVGAIIAFMTTLPLIIRSASPQSLSEIENLSYQNQLSSYAYGRITYAANSSVFGEDMVR